MKTTFGLCPPCDISLTPLMTEQCFNCKNRTLKIFWGNTGCKAHIKYLYEHGMGLLISEQYRVPHRRGHFFCIDNGAFSAFTNNVEWEDSIFQKRFFNILKRCEKDNDIPDFIVIPDVVGKKKESLLKSNYYIDRLPKIFRKYYAIQDDMEVTEVPWENIDGIFIGGSIPWKLKSTKKWTEYAHHMNKWVHVGRIGATRRILHMMNDDVDSIDSTKWGRFGHDAITQARNQKTLVIK